MNELEGFRLTDAELGDALNPWPGTHKCERVAADAATAKALREVVELLRENGRKHHSWTHWEVAGVLRQMADELAAMLGKEQAHE